MFVLQLMLMRNGGAAVLHRQEIRANPGNKIIFSKTVSNEKKNVPKSVAATISPGNFPHTLAQFSGPLSQQLFIL